MSRTHSSKINFALRWLRRKQANAWFFSLDAAHFVYCAYLGYLWCFVRIFIGSPHGRKRLNVLGALNAVTHEVIIVSNEAYINATTVCELLLRMAEKAGGLAVTVVLDNARYQHCKLVEDYAKSLGIHLLYLPSYSPHLNLIERLWKFVKKEVLYSRHYSDFMQFKSAVLYCMEHPDEVQQKKLTSLLVWNFQSFRKVQVSGA